MKTKDFQKLVLNFYRQQGRNTLPWRVKQSFYRILVSEMMLQQTQVNRVVIKYDMWLKRFPDFKTLRQAPLSEVLLHWQGLGYPKRAKALKDIAEYVISNNMTPAKLKTLTTSELQAFPGVGPYTAKAIQVFCYDRREVVIETNIRTVYIHHFFSKHQSITDSILYKKIEATLPEENYREWYSALMDYGSYLKQSKVSVNNKVQGYKKQSAFKGSNRELRGKLLRCLAQGKSHSTLQLVAICDSDYLSVATALVGLVKDGFITVAGGSAKLVL